MRSSWNGEGVILVPTQDHWKAFCPRLEAEGVDLEAVQRCGQLTVVDADCLMPQFMRDEMPDAPVFLGLAALSFVAIHGARNVAANSITATAKADAADVARAMQKVLQPELGALLTHSAEVRTGEISWPAHLQDKVRELQASGVRLVRARTPLPE